MTHLILSLLFSAAPIAALILIVLIGLGVTWYFADDEAPFGPASPRRVTFKRVVQNFFNDLADLFGARALASYAGRLWAFWGPRVTNRALIALIMGDIGIIASGQDVWAFIGAHKLLVGGIVLMHLLTPLSPAGAPAKLPPAREPGGLRGPGAEAEANGQLGAAA